MLADSCGARLCCGARVLVGGNPGGEIARGVVESARAGEGERCRKALKLEGLVAAAANAVGWGGGGEALMPLCDSSCHSLFWTENWTSSPDHNADALSNSSLIADGGDAERCEQNNKRSATTCATSTTSRTGSAPSAGNKAACNNYRPC